ncbi:MAG: diguanylate cyclase [Solirubrobacteraceae bacterium]
MPSIRSTPLGTLVVLLGAASLVLVGIAYAGPHEHALTFANAAWLACSLVAVIGAGMATRRSDAEHRQAWFIVLVACGSWLMGELIWTLYSATSFPASPNVADGFWLCFAIAGIGVYRLGGGLRDEAHMIALEIAPLVVATLALIVALMWDPIRSSDLPAGSEVTALAYPVLYVATAITAMQCVVAGALDLRDRGTAALVGGLILEALAFTLWCPRLLAGTYSAGTSASDALWVAGMLLIGVGAWHARPAPPADHLNARAESRGGVLPAITFVGLAAAQIVLLATGAATAANLFLAGGALIIGTTLAYRGALLRRRHTELLERLRDREAELESANAHLSVESRRDPLTGLANRLQLREDFEGLQRAARRGGPGYAFVLCDLDRFKAYNDTHGHQAGDRVLRQVAALLHSQAREGDRVYRYGGEELLIVMREQDPGTACAVAERHRAAIEDAQFDHPDNRPSGVVTLSAGVSIAAAGDTPEQVLQRADDALYAAKSAGRNRVAREPHPPPPEGAWSEVSS